MMLHIHHRDLTGQEHYIYKRLVFSCPESEENSVQIISELIIMAWMGVNLRFLENIQIISGKDPFGFEIIIDGKAFNFDYFRFLPVENGVINFNKYIRPILESTFEGYM